MKRNRTDAYSNSEFAWGIKMAQIAHDIPRSLIGLPQGGLTPQIRARGRRVMLLALLVLLLSIGDLLTTLIFLQSTGMEEVNPVAKFVMQSGSVMNILIFKAGSVFTCLSVILLIRFRWQGELAAWIATFILVSLTAYWYVYTHQFSAIDSSHIMNFTQQNDGWMILSSSR